MGEWISVKDRLPGEDYSLVCFEFLDNGEKLVTVDHISEYTPKSFFEGVKPLNSDRYRKATHWMPLPEPPKEGV